MNGAVFSDNGSFVLYTRESLENPNKGALFPDIQNGNGAFRLLGLEDGLPVAGALPSPTATATAAPNLQANSQLFLKSSLGQPATSVGPKGNMSIARRIILDAPCSVCVWTGIRQAGMPSASRAIQLFPFSMALCGYGQLWSCSVTILRGF